MFADPYLKAAWRESVRRARSAGASDLVSAVLLPLLALAVCVPLVRQTFLAFLDLPAELWGAAAIEVGFRADVLALSAVVLDLYERIVRGRDRAVLQSLPVDPAAVVRLAVVRQLVVLHRFVFAGAVLTSPLAFAGAPDLWAALVVSGWVCAVAAVPMGAVGHLGAVAAAESPAFAPLLELIRGGNHRAQAAFVYAPGAVLAVGGVLLRTSASAVPDLAAGRPLGLLVFCPLVGAALAAVAIPSLARATWFRGSVVVAEIDARYAAIEDPEEGRRVYLDWAVRFLPEPARLYALADLRHGWRARRTALSLQWLGAALAAGAAWTADPSGPFRAVAVAVGAVALVGAVGVQMDADEPALLRVTLRRHPVWAKVGRAAVLSAWSAPAPVAAALAVWMRGSGGSVEVLGFGAAAVVVAVAASLGSGPLRERGLRVYVPAVAVALAALLTTFGGGR